MFGFVNEFLSLGVDTLRFVACHVQCSLLFLDHNFSASVSVACDFFFLKIVDFKDAFGCFNYKMLEQMIPYAFHWETSALAQ